MIHNHPSGDPTPSSDDLDMTRQIEEAASVLEIAVRDHIIVGNGRMLSFRDEGLLGAAPRSMAAGRNTGAPRP